MQRCPRSGRIWRDAPCRSEEAWACADDKQGWFLSGRSAGPSGRRRSLRFSPGGHRPNLGARRRRIQKSPGAGSRRSAGVAELVRGPISSRGAARQKIRDLPPVGRPTLLGALEQSHQHGTSGDAAAAVKEVACRLPQRSPGSGYIGG